MRRRIAARLISVPVIAAQVPHPRRACTPGLLTAMVWLLACLAGIGDDGEELTCAVEDPGVAQRCPVALEAQLS